MSTIGNDAKSAGPMYPTRTMNSRCSRARRHTKKSKTPCATFRRDISPSFASPRSWTILPCAKVTASPHPTGTPAVARRVASRRICARTAISPRATRASCATGSLVSSSAKGQAYRLKRISSGGLVPTLPTDEHDDLYWYENEWQTLHDLYASFKGMNFKEINNKLKGE